MATTLPFSATLTLECVRTGRQADVDCTPGTEVTELAELPWNPPYAPRPWLEDEDETGTWTTVAVWTVARRHPGLSRSPIIVGASDDVEAEPRSPPAVALAVSDGAV